VVIFLDVNTFLSPRGGGIRTYHARKAAWFGRHGQHQYRTLQPGPARQTQEGPSANVHQHVGRGLPIGDNYRFLWDRAAAEEILRRFPVDCVEAGDPWATALWTSRLSGVVRSSFWHSDPHTAYIAPWTPHLGRVPGKLVARALGSFLDRTHRRFHVVWCASRWVRDLQLARGVSGAELLPFGIDHSQFQPQAAEPGAISGLGLDPTRPVLLYAGRLDPEKGTDVFEQAIAPLLALPQRPQIVVAGRGEQQERFRDRQHESYRYLGYVEDPAFLRSLYGSSTLLLSPCAVETFGLGVLESLHMGLPVVSAATGGGGEQVQDSGGGETFTPGDARDLVDAVLRALPRRQELSKRAAVWGAAWPSWDDMFRHQADRIEQLRDALRSARP
jgi:alpha-1,6-mannosyltransferase